jgi:hypothetical protein
MAVTGFTSAINTHGGNETTLAAARYQGRRLARVGALPAAGAHATAGADR